MEINFDHLSEEIQEEIKLFTDASFAYYNTDESIMPDEEFDELRETLLNYDIEELSNFIKNTIQTEEGLVNVSEVVTQMISLFKVKYLGRISINEIIKFLGTQNKLYYAPKLDGMAIKVIFEPIGNGLDTPYNLTSSGHRIVKQVITRGGLDVTKELGWHNDLQFSVNELPKTNIIHGELVVGKKMFLEKYSEDVNPKGYKNPRNAVKGILSVDPSDLRFIACTDGISPLLIENRGVRWVEIKSIDDFKFLSDFHAEFKTDDFMFQTDGIVIGYKVETQIIKDNYPINLVAVKFKAPTAETIVKDIIYTQKKMGTLTPVIIIEPTLLDGSTINKVAGYNYMNLKTKHIGIGSKILITKSGDIIPIVEKVLTRSINIPMPLVDYEQRGLHLYALDTELSENYRFVMGLKLLQIDGIGDTMAEQIGTIVNYDIIKLFDSQYKPNIRQILGGGKNWEKFSVFYNTKSIGLDLLINLLQFNRCGKKLSRVFAELITKKNPNLKGVDKSVLAYVCKGDGFKKIQESLLELKTYGVRVSAPMDISEDTVTFEMTGSPVSKITKQDFVERLKLRYPNAHATTLTKDTKYLFVDSVNSNSGKLNKARKYNTKIMTYEEALNPATKL